MTKLAVIIPNWNGRETLVKCLDSLRAQSLDSQIVVVENGSTDESLGLIRKNYADIDLIVHKHNVGLAGGVNAGIRSAIENNSDFVALFNNDAIADKDWLLVVRVPVVALVGGQPRRAAGRPIPSELQSSARSTARLPRRRGDRVQRARKRRDERQGHAGRQGVRARPPSRARRSHGSVPIGTFAGFFTVAPTMSCP